MINDDNLAKLNIKLPPAPQPLGQYAAVVEANNFVFLSGMLPLRDGVPAFTSICDKEQAREAAALAALNALAVLQKHFGRLSKIRRLVRVAVYIAAGLEFRDHAFVADGCSEVFNQIFPEKHARLAFGATSLPMNAAVELELIFQVFKKVENNQPTKKE
jgi:enamine deaminase RidA (YjgF/YER057c/UK114 family)